MLRAALAVRAAAALTRPATRRMSAAAVDDAALQRFHEDGLAVWEVQWQQSKLVW